MKQSQKGLSNENWSSHKNMNFIFFFLSNFKYFSSKIYVIFTALFFLLICLFVTFVSSIKGKLFQLKQVMILSDIWLNVRECEYCIFGKVLGISSV